MPVPKTTKPIRRLTVREIAFRRMRDWIEDGTLKPGEVIKDTDIAKRLGISRTPVREALQMLEQLGAIETVAGRHTRVSEVDVGDVELVLGPLGALHGFASRIATPRLTPADLEAMVAANERLADAVGRGDPVGARAADDDFHDVVLKRADNLFLTSAIEPLLMHARRIDGLYYTHRGASQASIDQHLGIIEAARAGDSALAAEITQQDWLPWRAFGKDEEI